MDVATPNIPPIDINAGIHVTDLTDDMELGRAARAGRGIPDGALGSSGGAISGPVLNETVVDRAPRVLGDAPGPRYPDMLRGAGITGRVMVQFVVDTSGRAEPASVQIMDATRAEFAESVRAALPRCRASGSAPARKAAGRCARACRSRSISPSADGLGTGHARSHGRFARCGGAN